MKVVLTAEQLERVCRRVEFVSPGDPIPWRVYESSKVDIFIAGVKQAFMPTMGRYEEVRFLSGMQRVKEIVERAMTIYERSLRKSSRAGRRAQRTIRKRPRVACVVDAVLAVLEEDDRKPVFDRAEP